MRCALTPTSACTAVPVARCVPVFPQDAAHGDQCKSFCRAKYPGGGGGERGGWLVGMGHKFFNLQSPGAENTKWQLVLQLKPWLGFERGSKYQILGSLTEETSKFYSCSRDHRLESQCMQTPLGVLYKLHMVSFHSALMRCFSPEYFLNFTLTFFGKLGCDSDSITGT